jgi:hypothetical protein
MFGEYLPWQSADRPDGRRTIGALAQPAGVCPTPGRNLSADFIIL